MLKKTEKKTKVEPVTQDMIIELRKLDAERLAQGRLARELDNQAKTLRELILERVKNKAKIEKGRWKPIIDWKPDTVRWKEEFEKRCGKEAVLEVKANVESVPVLVIVDKEEE